MRLATREETQIIEKLSSERFGRSGNVLMANAGRAIAAALVAHCDVKASTKILILCGPGNNGGDGRLVARDLATTHGVRDVIVIDDPDGVTSDSFADVDLVVDALFGIGLNRAIEGKWASVIQRLNASRRPIAAIDGPSGLDANRGVVLGIAVRARWTFACGPAKPGYFLQDGPAHCGRVYVLDVGFPAELVREQAHSIFLVGAKTARRLWPKLSAVANKTGFGQLLVIAGSPGTEGAAVLSSTAAARMGAGYVRLASPAILPFDVKPPDFLSAVFDDIAKGNFGKANAVVVGPGLGVNDATAKILARLRDTSTPAVVDADALTVLAKEKKFPLPPHWILTPHAGELSRLTGQDSKAIEADRLGSATEASRRLGCTVLLKGFHTVVASEGRAFIIASGGVALAKAGTGDVLAGFIGGLLAQKLECVEAAVLGAYLHGHLADRWVRAGRGERTLMASDLPGLFTELIQSGDWR